MASSTKRPAAKRAAGAAKKASRQAPAASAAKPPHAADAILKVAKSLEALRLRAAAAKLVTGRRQDLEAVVAANRKSFAGIQAVVKKQTEMIRQRIEEWRSVAKVMSLAGPKESIAQLDELAKQSFLLSLANVRELAELSAQTQAEAFELIKDRIKRNVAEVSALLDAE